MIQPPGREEMSVLMSDPGNLQQEGIEIYHFQKPFSFYIIIRPVNFGSDRSSKRKTIIHLRPLILLHNQNYFLMKGEYGKLRTHISIQFQYYILGPIQPFGFICIISHKINQTPNVFFLLKL